MRGAEVRGQEKQAVLLALRARPFERLKQAQGMAAQVHNGTGAFLSGQLSGNILKRRRAAQFPPDSCAPKCGIKLPTARKHLPRLPIPQFRQGGKIRLCGSGKHHSAAVFPAQGRGGTHSRGGKLRRQALGFVKQDNALGDVVELPAIPGAGCKQALEEADRGRYDKRRVPTARQFPLFLAQPALAVVRQNMRNKFFVFPLALFREREVGKHEYDAPFAMRGAVTQGKMQKRQGLTDARRGRQCEESGSHFSRVPALPENLIAHTVERFFGAGVFPQGLHMLI